MAVAEFEEREFETPLYQQLKVAQHQVWSPGQVLEGHVGFDYSALCVDSFFWAIHGIRAPLDGFLLEEMFHRRRWHRHVIPRPLPDFSLNLFLQAKRPEHLSYLAKHLKGCPLKAPHWRVKLNPEQHLLLEELAQGSNGKALVCYAMPAFHRLSQLYSHTVSGTVVENSSFPQALALSGHTAWNYDQPGATGVANVDPRYIELPGLFEQIERLRGDTRTDRDSRFDDGLKTLAETITQSVQRALGDKPRSVVFSQRVSEIDTQLRFLDGAPYRGAIRAFLVVLAFTYTFNLTWLVVEQ